MSVKKSALENLSDKKLEEYLVEGNRYVPEANSLAFEILKSRGRKFTAEEMDRITRVISDKSKTEKQEIIVHGNHRKAANLIYISGLLGIVNLLLSPAILSSGENILVAIFTLVIILGIGYLIGKGNDGLKYVLLVLLILGFIVASFSFLNIGKNPIVDIINLFQTVLQVYALILLFKIPKPNKI